MGILNIMRRALVAATYAATAMCVQLDAETMEFLPERQIEWVDRDNIVHWEDDMIAVWGETYAATSEQWEYLLTARAEWEAAQATYAYARSEAWASFVQNIVDRGVPDAELRTNLDSEFPFTNEDLTPNEIPDLPEMISPGHEPEPTETDAPAGALDFDEL